MSPLRVTDESQVRGPVGDLTLSIRIRLLAPDVPGDQDLNVTLTRFKRGWGLENPATLLAELTSIRDAVVGPPGTPVGQRLNLFRLLFTQERYIKEILLIVVPLSFIVLGALEAVRLCHAHRSARRLPCRWRSCGLRVLPIDV